MAPHHRGRDRPQDVPQRLGAGRRPERGRRRVEGALREGVDDRRAPQAALDASGSALLPSAIERTKRSMIRSRIRTTTQATIRMMAIVTGLAKTQSTASARPAESVALEHLPADEGGRRHRTSPQGSAGSTSPFSTVADPTVAGRDRPPRRLSGRWRPRRASRCRADPAARRGHLPPPAAGRRRARRSRCRPTASATASSASCSATAAAQRRARAPAAGQADRAGRVRVRQPVVERLRHRGDPPRPRARGRAWPRSRSSCRSPSPCW